MSSFLSPPPFQPGDRVVHKYPARTAWVSRQGTVTHCGLLSATVHWDGNKRPSSCVPVNELRVAP